MIAYLIIVFIVTLGLYCFFKTEQRARQLSHGKVHRIYLPWPFISSRIIPLFMLNLPYDWRWKLGYKAYEKDGIIFTCSPDLTIIDIANHDLIKEIYIRRHDFIKPTKFYYMLDIYGSNVVTTDGDLWKKHPKITASNFSERNNEYVYQQTIKTVNQMFIFWQDGGKIDVTENMMRLTLHIISAAGFGYELNWEEKASFKTAMQKLEQSMPIYMLVPKWMRKLPIKRLKEAKEAYDNFAYHIEDLISKAENSDKPNLLTSLVNATSEGDEKLSLSELKGNIFIYLFAGHETTANTLNFALTLLALYPDKQQCLFNEVRSVCGNTIPKYEDYNKLVYTLAVFHETLRMFPPVVTIPKCSVGDQRLGDFIIPDGSLINIHVLAVQNNPNLWGNDVDQFRPERWLEDNSLERYNFIAFSEGTRSCLGKRFAQVESVFALATICQKYVLSPPTEMTKENILDVESRITLKTKRNVELICKRR